MRVAIVYPPFTQNGAFPLLTQNRQFKYTASGEIRIYPVIPATAATILKEAGHSVLFLDGMNERLSFREFNRRLLGFAPELVVFETKAPLLKRHSEYIDWLKSRTDTSTVLVGDHITFFPEESMSGSRVDYCVVGGDYDVSLAQLAAHLEGTGKCPLACTIAREGRLRIPGLRVW